METNNKLVNIIFNESSQFEILEQENKEDECEGENGECNFFSSNIIELSQNGFNLKEMIQQEFNQQEGIKEIVEVVELEA